MDVLLQNHNAKHVCDIPDGLRELCADISREVIRSEPDDIYCFIADYLNTLLITRENAKVAIRIVKNVTMRSEHIVEILVGTGLRLDEIAAVAPRLQKAFKVYLNAVDEQKKECGCDVDSDVDDENEISICQILRATGASYPDAQRAAIKIQALFRGHHERMLLAESRGEVQWQRAAANTVDILRKSGVTRAQATHAAIIIQTAYRGYYTRKNFNIRQARDGKKPKEIVDMCAWFRMMFEESGITAQRANQAAIVIQVAYKQYRKRKLKETEEISSKASKEIKKLLKRKEDLVSEVRSEDHARSVKSEVKSEAKSQSEITDIQDKPEDDDDDVKTTIDVSEDQAQTKETVEVKQEPPEMSDAEAIGNVEQVIDEAENQIAKEQEEEEEEDNNGNEVKEDGGEEESKGDEVKETNEAEENKSAQVEDQVEEEKTEGVEE